MSRHRAGPWVPPPVAPILLVLASSLSTACIHIVQPQTYYLSTRKVRLQRDEYVQKDLVRGLPEAVFLRWYTRAPEWRDPTRPYILDIDHEGEATVYQLGSGGRTVARAYFENGRLAELGQWVWDDLGLYAYWIYRRHEPREVSDETLERVEALDAVSEVLEPGNPPELDQACGLRRGDPLESIVPIQVLRPTSGRRLWLFRQDAVGGRYGPDPDRIAGSLPTGARLVVRRRGLLGDVRLVDPETGVVYDLGRSLAGFCPAGACAPLGAPAVITRRITLARAPGDDAVQGYAAGIVRVPVWMDRIGSLPEGTRVIVNEWSPCESLTAEVEVGEESAPLGPVRFAMKPAPAGLFLPADAAPHRDGSDPARPAAPPSPGEEDGGTREQPDGP